MNSRSWRWTGRLACCDSWGRKESDTTERLSWTERSVLGFPGGVCCKGTRLPLQETQEARVAPWVWKLPWRRARPRTPVFLPGGSRGQRSLAGYRPWGHERVGHDLATKPQQQHSLCEQAAFVSPFISCWISELFPLFFTIVSHPATNVSVQVFMWTHVFISLRYIRSRGIARLSGRKKPSQGALMEKNLILPYSP